MDVCYVPFVVAAIKSLPPTSVSEVDRKRAREKDRERSGSSLPRLPNRHHPALLLAIPAHGAGALGLALGRDDAQGSLDVGDRPRAQQRHLLLQEQRDARADEQRVALEDVDVPEAGGLVQREVAGEEAREEGLEEEVGVVVGHVDEVLVEGGGFLGEVVQDEVVGGVLGAGVRGVEAEGEWAVEDIGEGNECVGWCREVEEQEGGDRLGRVSFDSMPVKTG